MAAERRLTRSNDDRLVAGVAGGIAETFGLDATLVRLGFVLLALFGGSGFVIYLAMWLIVPRADAAPMDAGSTLRTGVSEMRTSAQQLVDNVKEGWKREPPDQAAS